MRFYQCKDFMPAVRRIAELEAKDAEHYAAWKKDMAAWKVDRDRAERAEAELGKWQQAVGLASTCVPMMEIDVTDPIGMMQEVCAELERTKADADTYYRERDKVLVELEALKARDSALATTTDPGAPIQNRCSECGVLEDFGKLKNELTTAESMMSAQLKQILRAEAELAVLRLPPKKDGLTYTIRSCMAENAKLSAELEALKAENERLDTDSHLAHEDWTLMRQQRDEAEAELKALKARHCETCRRYETDTRLCQTMSQYHHPKFCCIHWEAKP